MDLPLVFKLLNLLFILDIIWYLHHMVSFYIKKEKQFKQVATH